MSDMSATATGVRGTTQSDTLNRAEATGQQGTLGDHTVTVGQANERRSVGSSVKSFFKAIWNGIKQPFAALANKIAEVKTESAFSRDRAALQKQLPEGITVSANGTISGTTTIDAMTPKHPILNNMVNKTYGEMAQARAEAMMTGTTRTKDYEGVTFASQSSKDIYRMNIKINDGGNVFSTVNVRDKVSDRSQVEKTVHTEFAKAIAAFTGGDKIAASLVTALIDQQFSGFISNAMTDADGNPMVYQVGNAKAGALPLNDQNGVPQDYLPKGIGGADVMISKDANGDIRISIDYEMALAGTNDVFTQDKADFVGMNGSLILADAHLEMVVDGSKLANHVISVRSEPITVAFSGQMAA